MKLEVIGTPERGADIAPYVDRGIEEALMRVRDRFEKSENPEDNLEFHNQPHTKDVMRRAVAILNVIRDIEPALVPERKVQLAKVAAAFHDVIQRYEKIVTLEGDQTKVTRKRFGGPNEAQSAEEAIAFMEEINKNEGVEIFSEDDKRIVGEAIAATVPGFNPEKGTVIQPNLAETSDIVTKATALADLGTAGIDGPERYLEEGVSLFREENFDVADTIRGLKAGKEVPESRKEYLKKRMLGWLKFQPTFARGRRDLIEKELGGIPEEARKRLEEELFTKFDASIEAAQKRADEAADLPFEDLARLMGYDF